jgi:hypothetical protein
MNKIINIIKASMNKMNWKKELEEVLTPCCPASVSEQGKCYGILGDMSPCSNPKEYKNCAGYIAHVNKIEVNYK